MAQNPYQPPVAKVTPGQRFRPPLWLNLLLGILTLACLLIGLVLVYHHQTTQISFVSFGDGEMLDYPELLSSLFSLTIILAAIFALLTLASIFCTITRRRHDAS